MPAEIRRDLISPEKEENLEIHPKREPFAAIWAVLAVATNSL